MTITAKMQAESAAELAINAGQEYLDEIRNLNKSAGDPFVAYMSDRLEFLLETARHARTLSPEDCTAYLDMRDRETRERWPIGDALISRQRPVDLHFVKR